jgi:hypothetical protein
LSYHPVLHLPTFPQTLGLHVNNTFATVIWTMFMVICLLTFCFFILTN